MVNPFLSWSTVSSTPAIARGRRRRMAAIMVVVSKVLVTTTFMGAWQQNVLAHAKVIGVQQAHRYR